MSELKKVKLVKGNLLVKVLKEVERIEGGIVVPKKERYGIDADMLQAIVVEVADADTGFDVGATVAFDDNKKSSIDIGEDKTADYYIIKVEDVVGVIS